MGNGIAQVFAQAGFAVPLVDVAQPMLDRARAQRSRRASAKFVEKGTLTAADRDAALGRLATADDRSTHLAGADYVVEAIVEDADAKRALFAQLDAIARPDVILASNTSSISITVLGAATKRPDSVLGMHFMNPGAADDAGRADPRPGDVGRRRCRSRRALCATLGKTAVEAADYPGFIANRILMPMINEAFYAVMEGVGTPEAIDAVMKLGMNHPMGPLTLADFIGLDVCLAILNVLHDGLGDPKYRPCPLLRRMVAAGQLGRKSGQRLLHVLDQQPQRPPARAIAISCAIARSVDPHRLTLETGRRRSVPRKRFHPEMNQSIAERPQRLDADGTACSRSASQSSSRCDA